MAKAMKWIALLTVIAAVGFSLCYLFFGSKVFLTLAITMGTIAYHFVMRLIVGIVFDLIMNNRADYTKKWFQVSAKEKQLYEKLHVRNWKNKMPTFHPELFDPSRHSWEEIAQAMCQSELVHETIMILCFVPVLFSIPFGDLAVFIITSVIGACIDLLFVIMQRYNRPRILRLIRKQKR